jgi:hypothetical protein
LQGRPAKPQLADVIFSTTNPRSLLIVRARGSLQRVFKETSNMRCAKGRSCTHPLRGAPDKIMHAKCYLLPRACGGEFDLSESATVAGIAACSWVRMRTNIKTCELDLRSMCGRLVRS